MRRAPGYCKYRNEHYLYEADIVNNLIPWRGISMKLSKPGLVLLVISWIFLMPSEGTCQGFSKTTPTAQNLKTLWGISDQNVFSAGDLGIALHFDGVAWTPQTSTTVFDLKTLWAGPIGAGFLAFAAGTSGVILSNNGSGWTQAVSPTVNTINGLWGVFVTEVFAVSDQGVILHFDGHTWSEMPNTGTAGGDLFSIWGLSGNNVYAGGTDGILFNFDGKVWSPIPNIPTSEDIRAIWGSSSSDIFLAGSSGEIIHFNGKQWVLQYSVGSVSLNALWGDSSDDVFVAGQTGKIFHFNGMNWTEITPLGISIESINAIWGSPSGKVFFAAQSGDILILERQGTFSPVVLASSPSDSQAGVSVSTTITFQFSTKMNPTTINNSSISLMAGSVSIHGQVTLSSDGIIATFTPDSALAHSTSYTASVSSGVKDVTGNTLKSAFSITFTTEGTISPESSSRTGGASGCFISCAYI
jgi:hypothetical protein